MTTALLPGLGLGFSLIVAIGAQNAYVLQVGVQRRAVGAVVAVCVASDVLLICAGTAGVGALVSEHKALFEVVKWAGVLVLAGYGVFSLASVRRATGLESGTARTGTARTGSAAAVVGTAAAITWLNPHVYLDTVLLLGSAAARYGTDRWWFAAGAAIASAAWFSALGFGAARLSGPLGRPAVWRVVNAAIGALLLVLALRLATLPLR